MISRLGDYTTSIELFSAIQMKPYTTSLGQISTISTKFTCDYAIQLGIYIYA